MLSGNITKAKQFRRRRLWSEVDKGWRNRSKVIERTLANKKKIEEEREKEQAKEKADTNKLKKLRKDLENVIPDTNREVMAEICAPKPNPASQAETYYSTNLGPRVVRNLIFKMGSERIEISYGWMVLERLRMGRYWTAPRLASAGLIDQKYRTQCPCCLENTKEDELHYLLECKTWNKERRLFLGDIEAYKILNW